MLANGQTWKRDGKCHRKYTAGIWSGAQAFNRKVERPKLLNIPGASPDFR
jgi:hypothetical protein